MKSTRVVNSWNQLAESPHDCAQWSKQHQWMEMCDAIKGTATLVYGSASADFRSCDQYSVGFVYHVYLEMAYKWR